MTARENGLAEQAARNRAADDGDERAEFQNAVPHDSFFSGSNSGQQAIFGRAENRAMHAH